MQPIHPPDPPTTVLPEWAALLEALPAAGRVLAIGPSDCGKTTLCWWLAGELAKRGPAHVVDADIGQSRIGPPACVGWTRLGTRAYSYAFVGTTSPSKRPASSLTATTLACEETAGIGWTVVDPTGFISGGLGVQLKRAKIGKLRPVHVLAIGDDPGVTAAVEPWGDDPGVTVHRLPVHPLVRTRPTAERTRWRREVFAQWLAGANLRWIGKDDRDFVHAPPRELYSDPKETAKLKGLLLGFSDEAGHCLSLGLLHTIDWRTMQVLALCHEAAERSATLDFGALRLEPDGLES